MKRSDMLLKLMETLVEAPEGVEEAAKYILAHIEKAGMLPPTRELTLLGNYYTENEWETEDEEE